MPFGAVFKRIQVGTDLQVEPTINIIALNVVTYILLNMSSRMPSSKILAVSYAHIFICPSFFNASRSPSSPP
jgi:hypothetical protein